MGPQADESVVRLPFQVLVLIHLTDLAHLISLILSTSGTLTLNKLTIAMDQVQPMAEDKSISDILRIAAYASRTENPDAIDEVVLRSLPADVDARKGIEPLHFTPFDPVRKRTEMVYRDVSSGKYYAAAKGLPSMLVKMSKASAEQEQQVTQLVDDFAGRGLRTIAVAHGTIQSEEDENPEWRKLVTGRRTIPKILW